MIQEVLLAEHVSSFDEFFRCVPYNCVLSPRACRSRRAALTEARVGKRKNAYPHCVDCTVGKEILARIEAGTPSSSAVTRLVVLPSAPIPPQPPRAVVSSPPSFSGAEPPPPKPMWKNPHEALAGTEDAPPRGPQKVEQEMKLSPPLGPSEAPCGEPVPRVPPPSVLTPPSSGAASQVFPSPPVSPPRTPARGELPESPMLAKAARKDEAEKGDDDCTTTGCDGARAAVNASTPENHRTLCVVCRDRCRRAAKQSLLQLVSLSDRAQGTAEEARLLVDTIGWDIVRSMARALLARGRHR